MNNREVPPPDPKPLYRQLEFLRNAADMVKSRELKDVARAFGLNFERIAVVEHLPHNMIRYATKEAFLQAQAQIEVTGGLFAVDPTDEMLQQIKLKAGELESRHKKWWRDNEEELAKYSYQAFVVFLGRPEAMMATKTITFWMLIGAWTAFEALATDLWVACVNARTELAEKAFDKKIPGLEDIKENAPKAIPFDEIKDYKYVLVDKMGQLLKDKERFNFNRLQGINRAYAAIFQVQSEYLSNSPNWNRLQELEAMRNVFVHHGGIADQQFRENLPSGSEFHKIPLGGLVDLTGAKVGDLVNVAGETSILLLGRVDKWLEDHPSVI